MTRARKPIDLDSDEELPQKRKCVGCNQQEANDKPLLRCDDDLRRCYQCKRERSLDLCLVKPTDLRAITRRADSCLTTVIVHMAWNVNLEWLTFGEANIRHIANEGSDELIARIGDGVTDDEHDAAYALILPLIGLRFHRLDYHTVHFEAWVDPNPESFRVPRHGYDPAKNTQAHLCTSKTCHVPHIVVPVDGYQPPRDLGLHALVAGKRISIAVAQPPARPQS
jgi:hypothetical protein